jgi:hypothetical protein
MSMDEEKEPLAEKCCGIQMKMWVTEESVVSSTVKINLSTMYT